VWAHESDFLVVKTEAQWSAFGLREEDLPAVVAVRQPDLAKVDRYTANGDTAADPGDVQAWNADDLAHWVMLKRFPKVVQVTRASWDYLIGQGVTCALVVGEGEPAEFAHLLDLAAEHVDGTQLRCGWLSGHTSTQFVYKYGLDPHLFPALVLLSSSDLLFWYDKQLEPSADAYFAYVQKVLSGELPGLSTNRRIGEKIYYAYSIVLSVPRDHPFLSLGVVAVLAVAILSLTFWYEGRLARQLAGKQAASTSATAATSRADQDTDADTDTDTDTIALETLEKQKKEN
jgi:hypothetical protein